MRPYIGSVVILMSVATVAVLPAGCGGGTQQTKPENQAAAPPPKPPEIGKAENVQGEQPVVESREVTRTISSEIPTVKITEYRGDLNRMNPTNFEVLGVSPDLSQKIINYRASLGGKFTSVDQLRQVPGMNDQIFSQLQPKVAVAK